MFGLKLLIRFLLHLLLEFGIFKYNVDNIINEYYYILMKKMILILFIFSLLVTINCKSINDINEDIAYIDQNYEIYENYKQNLQYNGEIIQLFDEITITNISFPLTFAGVIATAIEISTINKNNEIYNYYLFYIIPADQIREMLFVGKQYIFYYDIKEIEFNAFAGEEMSNIRLIKTRWLLKYFEIE